MRSLQTQAEWCKRAQWVLGIALVVMVVVFYTFAYRPNSQRLSDLQSEIDAKRNQLSNNRTQVQVLPDVLIAVNQMRTRLEKFDKKLPGQPDLGPFINDITELSHQAALRKVEVNPGVPQRNDSYAEWPISLKFEGDFVSAFSFLRKAEDMQRLTRVKNLKIRSTDAAKSGTVQVELSMNIYFSEG